MADKVSDSLEPFQIFCQNHWSSGAENRYTYCIYYWDHILTRHAIWLSKFLINYNPFSFASSIELLKLTHVPTNVGTNNSLAHILYGQ